MKVLVAHDKSGKIMNVAIPNPTSDRTVTPRAGKGHSVAEVDIPGLDLGAKDLAVRLSELNTKFKISIGASGPELVLRKK